jgi:hypothetical protein
MVLVVSAMARELRHLNGRPTSLTGRRLAVMELQYHSGSDEMKFWELTSVMRAEPNLLEVALRKPIWAEYYAWFTNLDKIVDAQDRGKLDARVPDALVRDALSGSRQTFYLYSGQLRSRRFTDEDVELSALDAFTHFGGTALEETLEKGSHRVTPPDLKTP